MTGTPDTLPEIDGDTCVHALAPRASCRACVDACPHGALVIDDESLGLSPADCTACCQCVPACPRGAIVFHRPLLVIRTGRDSGEAFAACARASEPGLPPLPCIHALGPRDLDALAASGVRRLIVATGDCAACPEAAGRQRLSRAAERHALVRHSRGEHSVALVKPGAAQFRRALARAREDEDRIDNARRRLFGAFVDSGPVITGSAAAPRAYVTPVIDPGRCTGCEACIRICPDGALRLERSGQHRYVVEPDLCSGCGLCVDVCEDAAVGLSPLGDGRAAEVPLDGFRCRACGVTVHAPAGRPRQSSLCRICARTGHHKSLFQVLDP